MKLLITDDGTVIGRYPDIPDPIFPIDPIPGPGQSLVDVPTNVIGEAVIKVINGNFIVDQPSIDNQWNCIKIARNSRLVESDWTCSVTDYVVANKSDWIAYRQALRTITEQPNPFRLVWPTMPSSA